MHATPLTGQETNDRPYNPFGIGISVQLEGGMNAASQDPQHHLM